MLVAFLIPTFRLSINLELSAVHSSNTPREGWAVLMEMNFYASGSDLDTGYSDTNKWNDTLHILEWQTNHILIHQGPIVRQTGEDALQFLAMNVDANDIVLFFVFAHGNYLLNEVKWNEWFPTKWKSLMSHEKLFIVAACTSELILQPLYDDPNPHISIASTEADEYAWAGLPEEELPIIGEVFNHFLTNALVNASADTNMDGEVTVEEAFVFASPLSRSYISSTVFPVFPDFAEICQNIAPHPVIDDGYLGNFSLQVDPGEPPILPPQMFPLELGLLVGGGIVLVIIIGLYIIRARKTRVSQLELATNSARDGINNYLTCSTSLSDEVEWGFTSH
jgi:hypothetical protein